MQISLIFIIILYYIIRLYSLLPARDKAMADSLSLEEDLAFLFVTGTSATEDLAGTPRGTVDLTSLLCRLQ
jgi:hypothetical protein